MAKANTRIAYPARFLRRDHARLFREAKRRGISVRQLIDESVSLYFSAKGSDVWRTVTNSG